MSLAGTVSLSVPGHCLVAHTHTPTLSWVLGWVGQRPNKRLCSQIRPPIWAPFNEFHTFSEEKFSDLGGGGGLAGVCRAPQAMAGSVRTIGPPSPPAPQAVFASYGPYTHMSLVNEISGIPIGPDAEVDRKKALGLVVFERQAGAEAALRGCRGTAITAVDCTSKQYVTIQTAVVKYTLRRAQTVELEQKAKAAVQATGKLITDKFNKAKSSVTSGFSKAFGGPSISKVFGKKN